MSLPKITNQGVAVYTITLAVCTVFGSFWLSRGDHDLKLMSLQAVLTTGGTLLGIAGTLLVGIQAYQKLVGGHDATDVPSGSILTSKTEETLATPPVDPATLSASQK